MWPKHYRLIVEGELGPRYASAFRGMTVTAHGGTTEIAGGIIDSSHLQGLLEQIAGLGITLHSVTPIEARDAEPDAQTHKPPAGINDHDPGAPAKGR